MKRIGTLLFTLAALDGFSGISVPLSGATIYHSDGSAASVQALYNKALDGDTITLPSGTFTWSTPVTISKAIKIQGEGSGRIIGWSRSSQIFGTGAKTFVVQNGFTAATGTILRIWRIATNKETSYMLGTVTSVSGTSLTVNVTSNTGNGSASLWLIATEPSTRVSHGAGANSLLSLRESTAGDVEVLGIQFTTATGTGTIVALNYTASGRPILIHDCWFYQTTEGSDIIRDLDTNRGVIWDCSFAWSFWAQSNSQALHFPLNNRTEVWSSPSTMGMADGTGANNFYVEDCDFHGGVGVSDFDSNSKVVWRHNINDHAGLASHGYDTSAYGTRHWEIYDNQFLFANLGDCDGSKTLSLINHMLLRGGTGVIANNYIEDITSCAWGNKPEIQFGVWCLGRWSQSPGAYDADDNCVAHYPAPRQFGFGRATGSGVDGQGHATSNGVYAGDSEPAYIWGNTGFQPTISVTTDGSACATNQYGHVPDSPTDYIQAGRDYIMGVKPGYVKFTYPHPLRTVLTQSPPTSTATVVAVNKLQKHWKKTKMIGGKKRTTKGKLGHNAAENSPEPDE